MSKRIFVGDFETTVYENQTSTEVWASALVELNTDNVIIFHSIEETYDYITVLDENLIIYYHNLKFDGAFWIDFLIRKAKYEQAFTQENNDYKTTQFIKTKDMKNNTFKYLISETGMFYSITIKHKGKIIEIRDSYKLLPFSVKKISKSFDTKHKKSSIEYTGYRYAGCEITPEEKQYIANDVLVIKEALEIMYEQGHNKLTIGSCCIKEFKDTIGRYDWEDFFPNLTQIKLDENIYGSKNADKYCRKAYKGGWCYLNPKYKSRVLSGGYTLDVNSLYPSMMCGKSGNTFPIGLPHFWKGERPPITYQTYNDGEPVYYFIRIKTRFRIKPNHLPFIQVKNNFLYSRNTSLTTSNYIDKEGKEHEYLIKDGKKIRCELTLTLTKTDYELFLEHYNIEYLEILDGCWFYTMPAEYLFDKYINKYKKIKMNSVGAIRELAKLFLNNLYGKLATSDNSSFKVAYYDEENDCIKYFVVPRNEKPVVYIPIGSAITSYARNFTIRASQNNFDNFVYADTDSMHCIGDVNSVRNVVLDDSEFCCWKHESNWDIGYFTRQKTYIEHVTYPLKENQQPYYDIKCAGMPDKCKQLFIRSMTGDEVKDDENLPEDYVEFINKKRTLNDFDIGLKIPGKLIPKRITGGIILNETTYELR